MLLGMLGTAALPPFFLLPLLVPSFAGLFLLTLNAKTPRQAFAGGWWWGLGHFTAGLYWVCISLYVEPDKFAWLTPFALFGLPSILGIYTALATLALYHIAKKDSSSPSHLVIVFALIWIALEYLRAHLFTGFPWNLTGYAWNMTDATLQAASLWGIYGQSFTAVALATVPALFAIPTARALPALIKAMLVLVCLLAFGIWRLETHPTENTATSLRVVQANIAQSLKFDRKTMMDGLRKHADLTRNPGLDTIEIVVWPETSVPYLLSDNSELSRSLGGLLKNGTLLLTGGMRGTGDEKNWTAWNSAFVIDAAGSIKAQYDKHHLVPFGEFIPLRTILPLDSIAGGMGDFSRGPGPSTLAPETIPPFSPLICYEAIFPDEATDNTAKAEWLANITNDAWFGTSTGPYQHMEMARTRAVEQGLPLVRAANTGISAVTDAYGRVLKTLPLGKDGIIDILLPKPTGNGTIFSRFHGLWILVIILLSYCFLYGKIISTKPRNNLVD